MRLFGVPIKSPSWQISLKLSYKIEQFRSVLFAILNNFHDLKCPVRTMKITSSAELSQITLFRLNVHLLNKTYDYTWENDNTKGGIRIARHVNQRPHGGGCTD